MTPPGFVVRHDFLTADEEIDLIRFIETLPWGNVRMHGVTAKRRVAQFGYHYSFDSFRLTATRDIPAELLPIRQRAAAFAAVEPAEFAEALATEYPPGAGIGWHRDAPPFGIVAGISLGGSCRMRFQKGKGVERVTAAVELLPRSTYLLTGEVRTYWQHTIPPVKHLRYSITFRTVKRNSTVS